MHDGIPRRLLRDGAEEITPSLTNFFNASINSGIFPDDFKLAIISPIYKSGDKTICDNYRPISIQEAFHSNIMPLLALQISGLLAWIEDT